MKQLSTSLSGRKDPTRVPMHSSNVPSRPAGEVYNCGMLPAGISNSANNYYSSAILQCLFNHPSFPSLVIPNAVVLTAANFQVSEYSIELTIIQVLARLPISNFQVSSVVLLHSEHYGMGTNTPSWVSNCH